MKLNKQQKEAIVTFFLALTTFITIFSFQVHKVNENYGLFAFTGYLTNDDANGTISLEIIVIDTLPEVELISPPNNYISTSRNISLKCNATDNAAIRNVTLYHNFNGNFEANQTVNTSSGNVEVQFNFVDIPSGEYTWNCLAEDNTNHSVFAPQNYTFQIMSVNTTVLVDGTERDNLPEAGTPYNLTVKIIDNQTSQPVAGIKVIIEETNSLSFFSMPQISDSIIISRGIANTITNGLGIASLTIIPTGGITSFDTQLGGYNVTVKVLDSNNQSVFTKILPVLDRDPSGTASPVSIPNRENIGTGITSSFQLFSSLNDYLNDPSGDGINHYINYNLSSGIVSGMDFTLYASQPAAFNVNVFDNSGPVQNAIINITESIGYYIFAYPQFSDIINSDVSNVHTGSVLTNATGLAQMVMVPTGGSSSFDSILGPYFISIEIFYPNGTLAYRNASVNIVRTITGPLGFTLENIPNDNNIGSDTTNLIMLIANINDRLNAN